MGNKVLDASQSKKTTYPFFNRELSWLEFNFRVLEEALDESIPLLERTKFLAIFSSNLDEFFMVRVAGIKDQINVDYTKKDPSGLSPAQQFEKISSRTHELVNIQYHCLRESIVPELEKEGIQFITWDRLSEENQIYFQEYFDESISPVLTPMAYDQGRPLPALINRRIYLFIQLQKGKQQKLAFVEIPQNLPRFIQVKGFSETFIILEEIIKNNLNKLFRGYEVVGANLFRFTRNADLSLDEEGAEDLLTAIERELRKRKTGNVVRVEMEKSFPEEGKEFFKMEFDVEEEDFYEIDGLMDLTTLFRLSGLSGYNHLRYPPFQPVSHFRLRNKRDIFREVDKKNLLMHHPFDSFDCVIRFLQQAADDPNVLSIKQTLYRVSGESPVIKALIKAAENGKNVTVLVELKARFDEEANINWARELERAGCHVIYGLVGLKIHCKALLVIRNENGIIKRYCHLGTGNYNDKTAELYTDLGFFTTDEVIAADMSELFNVITGFSQPQSWRKLLIAPLNMRQTMIKMIEEEAKASSKTNPGRIIAKMNSLVDKEIIEKLYEASQKHVQIDLIIRGICCLVPGVEGVSENIRVISIVGRFLEHTRIFYFQNSGNSRYYLGSADWMPRNLNRRIESIFPVEDKESQDTIKKILAIYLSDNTKSRLMQSDGTYIRKYSSDSPKVDSQQVFMQQAVGELKKRELNKIIKPAFIIKHKP